MFPLILFLSSARCPSALLTARRKREPGRFLLSTRCAWMWATVRRRSCCGGFGVTVGKGGFARRQSRRLGGRLRSEACVGGHGEMAQQKCPQCPLCPDRRRSGGRPERFRGSAGSPESAHAVAEPRPSTTIRQCLTSAMSATATFPCGRGLRRRGAESTRMNPAWILCDLWSDDEQFAGKAFDLRQARACCAVRRTLSAARANTTAPNRVLALGTTRSVPTDESGERASATSGRSAREARQTPSD